MKNSSFIRDLLVKVLLIVIFIFLLMKLFPMPNLTAFYSKIFNENIQTMKDAAEDYYTTERMPSEVGKSTRMTLQEMIDQNLVLPFVDKDGNSCDTKKSYVKVTKLDTEYELKVSLTCGKESNYIIEKIGCYNFCPTGNCTLAEAKQAEKATTKTDDNGKITVVNPNGHYETEYEFTKTLTDERWKTGDWTLTRLTEDENTKLVDTKTEYTGKKKVSSGTKLYEQIAYDYKDTWTYDETWSDTKSTKENAVLWKTRTLYTGQKKVDNGQTLYEHIKYGIKDHWTYDEKWSENTRQTSDTVKLWKERTIYTGQKRTSTTGTSYQHVKYGTEEKWTETGFTTASRKETDDIKVIDTRYTVTKDIKSSSTSCTNYVTDSNWYSSKPANTSSRQYSSTPVNSKTETSWNVIYNSYKSYTTMATYSGNRKYEFLYSEETTCTANCGGKSTVKVYYYRVYEKSTSTKYQYKYCTPKTTTSSSTDTRVVYDVKKFLDDGYKIIKTEWNYKVRTVTKKIVDTKWTNSKTSPAGYEYTGKSSTSTQYNYEQLDHWVTNKDLLGEYTYNVVSLKQYKYATNKPEIYVIDTKWTDSKTSPKDYTFTGNTKSNSSISYVPLGKWVGSKAELGEYTYNIQTVTQYKYKYLTRTKYIKDTKWTTENKALDGYVLTGNVKDTTKTTYIDLGRWVSSKAELKEYTYDIQTRTLYKYKTRSTSSTTDTIWAKENPGNGYEPTGRSRKVFVSDRPTNVQK